LRQFVVHRAPVKATAKEAGVDENIFRLHAADICGELQSGFRILRTHPDVDALRRPTGRTTNISGSIGRALDTELRTGH
jgi:hypothetical protein